jgi:hypothetical protein
VHVAVLVLDTGRLPAVDSVSFEPVDMRGVPLDRCCVSVWWWWWLGGGGGGQAGPCRGCPWKGVAWRKVGRSCIKS